MKNVLRYLIRIFLFWMLFFLLTRFTFYLMLVLSNGGSDGVRFLHSEFYGLKMDMSLSGYIVAVSGLILSAGLVFGKKPVSVSVINGLNRFLIVVFGIFLAIDTRLYKYWDYHIEASILNYLKTPGEAMASANMGDWIIVVVQALVVVLTSLLMYRYMVLRTKQKHREPDSRKSALWSLLVSVVMILPIRGGLDVAPINVSSAFFSGNNHENHIAINPVWNLVFSLTEYKSEVTPQLMSDEESEEIYNEVFLGREKAPGVLNVPMGTNVVIVVLESFTANVVAGLGGIDSVTPNLTEWIDRGVSFSNFYSSGDRSDRGLTTIYTGFPSLPTGRLLNHPSKLSKVPNLYRNFKDKGYKTSFYYGGNPEFANIKLLFTEGQVDDVVSGEELPGKLERGKWGVRDGDMFARVLADIEKSEEPFFTTLYTLSSHEPFDIPPVSLELSNRKSPFYKAVYYTDSCFGQFMTQLKASPKWKNTLVVVTADHGVKKPEEVMIYSPRKFRIPLLFTGGVVDSTNRYEHYASHTDLPYTLEREVLGIENSTYRFSKSVFDTSKSFAHYFYHLGTGLVTEGGCVVYDIKAGYFLVNYTDSDSVYQAMSKHVLGVTQQGMKEFQNY